MRIAVTPINWDGRPLFPARKIELIEGNAFGILIVIFKVHSTTKSGITHKMSLKLLEFKLEA